MHEQYTVDTLLNQPSCLKLSKSHLEFLLYSGTPYEQIKPQEKGHFLLHFIHFHQAFHEFSFLNLRLPTL